ncbi:MAG: TonB-dependent receptor [Draconibacterium sp.]
MIKTTLLVLLLFISCLVFSQHKQYTISGYISDEASGEKLINANVYESVKLVGTISNVYGFYSLTLPEGEYNIVYSFVGFRNTVKQITLSADMEINVNLEYAEAIEEVTVVAGAVSRKLTDSQISKEVLSIESIERLPAFLGEADVMKTLQLMPGVQSGSEASSGLYVRGGGPDQNLILLDGVPVYNANHLFGFFSVFNTDAIKNVSLYKGGFPARFGGRLSSVVDIRMKEGNEKELHGGVQVGLISSKFHLEGPFKKDKTAFHISARRTYVDLITRPLMPDDEKVSYFFYDMNAKINHKFSDRSRLYLSAYAGRDKASDEYESSFGSNYYDKYDSKLYWGNLTTALRWNYIFSNKLFANTTLTYSDYRFNVDDWSEYHSNNGSGSYVESVYYKYKSGIEDWSAKIAFDWYPSPRHEIKFGTNYIYHSFNPGVETIREKDTGTPEVNKTFGDGNTYSHELSAYIEDNVELGARLKANIGLHVSAFNVEGEWYKSLEPRASVRYLLSDKLTVKVAYSKMQQYLHLLSNSTIGLPTDLWLPTTKRVKPEESHQYAVGWVYSKLWRLELSVEGFYKEMKNIIEYKEGASFFGSSLGWEDMIESGQGHVYGIELMAKKDVGKTSGWIAYTWSKNERRFDDLNFGEWFPTRYDRRHDASIVLTHKLSDKVDFGATWVYGTGNAITLATHEIEQLYDPANYWGNSVPYFEHRNNYRMPAYHRLDLGVNFHKQKKKGVRTWNVSVYNAYGRKNPFYLYVDNNNNGQKVLKQVSLFPVVPSVSYTYKF